MNHFQNSSQQFQARYHHYKKYANQDWYCILCRKSVKTGLTVPLLSNLKNILFISSLYKSKKLRNISDKAVRKTEKISSFTNIFGEMAYFHCNFISISFYLSIYIFFFFIHSCLF